MRTYIHYLILITLLQSKILCLGQDSNVDAFHPVPSSFLIDTKGNLSIEQVVTNPAEFKDIASITARSDPDHWVWIQMDFKGSLDVLGSSDNIYLKTTTFSYGSVFLFEEVGFREYPIGRFDRSNEKTRTEEHLKGIPVQRENLADGRYIYLKVKRTESFSPIAKWQFGYVFSSYDYIQYHYWSKASVRQRIPVYVFSGICLIMFLLTLAFFLYSWKKEFLFYSLYTFFLFIYLCGPFLEIHELLFANDALTGYWFIQSAQVMINLCYVLFVSYYLNTAKTYPVLHKVLKGIAIMLVVFYFLASYSMLTTRFSWYIQLMNAQRIVMSVFALGGMIYLLLKPRSKLVYFIVSGSFLYLAGALGFLFLLQRIYMISGASLEIFIFAVGLTYKIQKEQKEKSRLEKVAFSQKIKALRAQINPHFVFNSLGSIQHLISKGDGTAALSYLTRFSRLMRKLMENSIESNVTLSDEIEIINGYLELEALRFDNSFKYEIKVDEAIDPDITEIPGFVIQPYVENAVLHGLLPKEGDQKEIYVTFYNENGSLLCEIDDNGIGRAASAERRSPYKANRRSRGMEVTRKRLELINNNDTNSVQIIDKTDPNGKPLGTTVIIRITRS